MFDDFIGLVLGERYEIRKLLGIGGMSLVFVAHDSHLDCQMADKIIKPEFAWSSDAIDAFIKETRIIANLQHLHILTVYDYGTQIVGGQELTYLVMQLAGGGTLQERLERQPLALNEAGRILKQVCSALDYAHDQGVLHLDVKPGNILFDKQGNALVADFGLARLFQTSHVTAQNVAGTPPYMPLEQWRGKPAGRLSDVYALGITLHEALTGALPKRELTEEGLFVHLEHFLSPRIRAVVERATQSDPGRRYNTAGELFQAFIAAIAASAPHGQDTETLPPNEIPSLNGLRIQLTGAGWAALITGLAALIIVACLVLLGRQWLERQVREMVATLSPTLTPSYTVTATPIATLSPSPTLTPSSTITLTPTPSPMPYLVVPAEQLYVYTGPGENYDVVGKVYRGDRLPLCGRSADGTWWQVDYLGRKGWIRAQSVGASVEPTFLSTVEAPPTPARTPTPTGEATPSLPGPNTLLDLQNPRFNEDIQDNFIPGWYWWAADNYPDEEYDPSTSYNTPFFVHTPDPARMIDGLTLQVQATAFVKFKVHIFQTASVSPAATVRFQVLAKAYSDLGGIKLAAGLDPNGGSDCSQARWGDTLTIDQSDGTVELIAPDAAVGGAGRVTICLYAETALPAHNNAAYFDNAILIANPE